MNNFESIKKVDCETDLNTLEEITNSTSDEAVLTQVAKIINLRLRDIVYPDKIEKAFQILHAITDKTPTRSKTSSMNSERLMQVAEAICYVFYERKQYLKKTSNDPSSFYINESVETSKTKTNCTITALKTLGKIIARTSNKEVLKKVASTYYDILQNYGCNMSDITFDITKKNLERVKKAIDQVPTHPKSIANQPKLPEDPKGRDGK